MREGVTEIESAINIYEAAHILTVRCADVKSQGGYTTLGQWTQSLRALKVANDIETLCETSNASVLVR